MFSPSDQQCLAILQAAASSAFGIVVGTNNPTKARQALYRVRKDFGDPTFADIQIKVSPDNSEGEIWLLRRTNASEQSLAFNPTFSADLL